jgi:TonB family protein
MEMQSDQQQSTRVHETSSVERRLRVRRSPLALTCVTLGESDVGIVANISISGMRLTSAEPLRENCFSHLSIRLPQLYGAVQTRAEIVWMTASKKEAGVRFVDLPREVREQIRMWVSLAPENRESQAREERPRHLEHDFATVPMVAAMPSRPASSESVPQSWPLTEVRRAEFERMFPSENRATKSRDVSPSQFAVPPEPVGEAAQGAASAIGVIAPEPGLAHSLEEESALQTEPDRNMDDPFVRAAPTPRAPLQTLRRPPAVLEPIDDRSLRAAFRTESTDLAGETRPRRIWPIAALAIVLVVICFALGFAAGPAFLQNWMKAQHPRQLILEELSRSKPPAKNADLSNQNAANAAAPRLNVPAGNQGAAPELPARRVDENKSGSAAPQESEPGDGAKSQLAEGLNNGASEVKTPDGRSTSKSEPFAPQDKPKLRFPKKSTSSANLSTNADEIFNATDAPPQPAGSTLAPIETAHDSKQTTSEPREMTPLPSAEEPASSAAPAANAATNVPASPKTPTATETPDTSLTAENSATNSATTATDAPTHHAAPSDVPLTAPLVHPAPATPPVRAAEPAPRPANPPPSFFPVVAPGAGNVPRLLELPLEQVIETAAVLIQSRQFVFVPAQPGPESAHKPERVQIGDRIAKVAPAYPAQAAQKQMGGTVHLRATIGKDGTVKSVRPINGPTSLIPSAIDAVRQWRYQPTLLEQQPIEMQEDITIVFRPLDDRKAAAR